MATKRTLKNRINTILTDSTKGFHVDNRWQPVHATWNALRDAGYDVEIEPAEYGWDDKNEPTHKVWRYTVTAEKYTFRGVLTAHAAGTVEDPMARYDISAYIC